MGVVSFIHSTFEMQSRWLVYVYCIRDDVHKQRQAAGVPYSIEQTNK